MKPENLCEKYRATCFLDIKGQDYAIDALKAFLRSFGMEKKALILYGPVGTGKTSLAYALASEMNLEILEMNASDLRNRENVDKIIRSATEQKSFFSKGKIILVDEADGISISDYGGLPELISLIDKTNFPIIITANDIWNSKFSSLRKKCKLVQLKELNYKIIVFILQEISKKEKIQLDQDQLTKIAINSKGDVRAALNDLQVFMSEKTLSTETISERDKEETIFNAMRFLFKNTLNDKTLRVFDSVNLTTDEIFLWLEENIPYEYKEEELHRAFDALSVADVFRGRIHRQQHWRFLVYENLFLSAGVASSKKYSKSGFTPYKRPERILKIWMSNQKNKLKKSIIEKYAKFTHCSKKRAAKEFYFFPYIIDQVSGKKMRLEQEEFKFLKDLRAK